MSWDNLFWSHHVHRYLGETLHYYFLNVKPFDSRKIATGLRELMEERRLGSIRAYSVFGRHDLVVRTWLHPAVAVYFPVWLDAALPDIRQSQQFTVTDIAHSWYDCDVESEGQEATELLSSLHDHNITGLQEGEETALLSRIGVHVSIMINMEAD